MVVFLATLLGKAKQSEGQWGTGMEGLEELGELEGLGAGGAEGAGTAPSRGGMSFYTESL